VISGRPFIDAPPTPDTFTRPNLQNARPEDVINEVEEILDVRVMKGWKEYFLEWVRLPITRCEWVLPGFIKNARVQVEAFERGLATSAIGKRKRSDDGGRRKV
jgi:hypothetical protein